MSKHTPGPWKIVAFVPDERYEIATAESTHSFYRSVATVTFGYSEPAETEQHANAKLIAAAPELLNAVRFLLSNPDNRISDADLAAANAVITKATA